jgi:hypothetical protein
MIWFIRFWGSERRALFRADGVDDEVGMTGVDVCDVDDEESEREWV